MTSIGSMLLLQLILILLNAVFACAEIAIISINDNKLAVMASQGDKRAKRLLKLTSQPAKFLATIQVAITLSGFLGSAFAAENFSDVLVEWIVSLGVSIPRKSLDTIAVVLITIILSYFTLILGELVPKRVAMRKAEKLGLALSGLISGISKLFAPIVWFLSISTNGVLRLLGIDPNEEEEEVSEEEIRMMVDVGSEKGTIDSEEKEFIQNVFEFDDLTAESIATHRTDVDFLWMEESDEEWDKVIHETRHTLYPVCQDSTDNVVGILNAKDYFRLDDQSRESVLQNAVKPAYFIPESIKADVLFKRMRKERVPLAVVLDEYGGMVGIVTITDLVEQIVGDLDDTTDAEDPDTPKIIKIDDTTWKVTGNVELADLEREMDITIDGGESDTLSGVVFTLLDSIPNDGKQNIQLETDVLRICVTDIQEHQIAEATVSVKEKEETPEESEE